LVLGRRPLTPVNSTAIV